MRRLSCGRDRSFSTPQALERRVLLAATNYVAPNGSDAAWGDLARPLLTIQEAADRAVAGDTVLIRGGVYRETVTVPHSGTSSAPITFRPYNNEAVVVSGADLLKGWTQYSGSIYKAPQSSDLGEVTTQLLVDGQPTNEARWLTTTLAE